MSSTSGWITYEGGEIDFPFAPQRFVVWNCAIEEWSRTNSVRLIYIDPYWVKTLVTKNQVLDFIDFAYGDADDIRNYRWHDGKLEVESLRAQVARALKLDGVYVLQGFDY